MNTFPTLGDTAFGCPHCRAFAQHHWYALHRQMIHGAAARNLPGVIAANVGDRPRMSGILPNSGTQVGTSDRLPTVHVSTCTACGGSAIWLETEMIFPKPNEAPQASPDMPPGVIGDYNEAAAVVSTSPRAAAALLRLATEKLLGHLLQKSAKIDSMIADFVALGAPPQIQKAMDILRVTGNEAVHPGTMDKVDDQQTALAMFNLVNLIVDVMITQPRHIAEMYENLPAGKREAIEVRNAKASREN